MTPHQFAAVMLRLFALWLLFTATQISVLTYAMQRNGPENTIASYAMAALYLAGALLLWRFPSLLADKILPKPDTAAGTSNNIPRAADAAAVAFVSAGLLVIALKALTPVANYLSLISMLLLSGQSDRLAIPSVHIDGAVGTGMLVIGLLMIAKSRSLGHRLFTA